MNRFIGVGRLTRDPELKTIENSENKYVEITLAIDRNFKNKDGEKEADFINCVFWNKTAERLCEYVKKGHKIGVIGAIRTGSFEKEDGTKRYTTKVYVDELEFLENKNNDKHEPEYIGPEQQSGQEDAFADFGQEVALSDEDLPF